MVTHTYTQNRYFTLHALMCDVHNASLEMAPGPTPIPTHVYDDVNGNTVTHRLTEPYILV